ncbi:MAG: hypothetical protein LBF56_00040 [Holosporales bacterium]|nr:hypothetical protein [Holosporales bacterium]
MRRELKEATGACTPTSVCNFKEIAIKQEMLKIQNKLKILSLGGNFDDGGNIA